MGVVEPSVISVVFHVLSFFVLLLGASLERVWTTSGVAVPLSVDRVLAPGRRENLTKIELVEVRTEVVISHPPVAVVLEYVIQLFFKTLVVVPCLIFVGEFTRPFSLSPRRMPRALQSTLRIDWLSRTPPVPRALRCR